MPLIEPEELRIVLEGTDVMLVLMLMEGEEIVEVATPEKLVTTAALATIGAVGAAPVILVDITSDTVAEMVTLTLRHRDCANVKASGGSVSGIKEPRLKSPRTSLVGSITLRLDVRS